MSKDDYASIVDRSWDSIPPVELLPQGSWLLRGQNATYQAAKGDGSPSVLFVYKVKEPMDDVTAEDIEKLGQNYDVEANKIFTRFWIGDNSDWDKVRKHLAKHGVDTTGKSISDSLKEFKGTEIVAYLDQRSFQNNAGETQEDNVASNFTPVS